MTNDAPERIWVWVGYDGNWDGTWLADSLHLEPPRLPDAEYIRADHAQAEKEAAVAAAYEDAADEVGQHLSTPEDVVWADDAAERIRDRANTDALEAAKEAAVAAEREACASRLKSLKDTAYQNNLLAEGITYSCAIDAIRDRANTDAQAALKAVKREARSEALRELLQVNEVHWDKNWYPSLKQSILALIPADQEGGG